MKRIIYLFSLVLLLLLGGCASPYLPFKIGASNATPCENTFNFSTLYKSN